MADEVKKYISKVTLPNNEVYYIKDAEARADIQIIYDKIKGGMHYIGPTTSTMKDDSATPNPVIINGKSVVPVAGDIVTSGSKEYVFDGEKWHEMGDLTGLKALAYKDEASGTYTPSGTVSKPTFTGSQSNVTFTAAAGTASDYTFKINGYTVTPTFTGKETNVTITVAADTNGNYTPAGTVSKPTFTGDYYKLSGKTTAAGTVSKPTFAGDSLTSTGKVSVPTSATTTAETSNKSTTVSPASSGTVTYTPAGTISGTAVTLNTATVNSITSVGSLPALGMSVADGTENLVITWSAGELPVKGNNQTVATSVKSVTQGTFAGTGVRLVTGNIAVPSVFTTTLSNSDVDVSVTGTPTGSVSQPTFTGSETAVTITSAAGTSTDNTFRVAGSVSQPTFTGTKVKISGKNTADGTISTVTHTDQYVKLTGKTTASGSVSQPTFTGTEATITVS